MNNPLSFSSLKLDLFAKDGTPLKQASGFVVEARNRYYLITNRHLLSEAEFSARDVEEPVAQPHLLKTTIHIHGGEGETSFPLSWAARKRMTFQLYDEDGTPKWKGRQTNKPVDVVALRIQWNLTLETFLRNVSEPNLKGDYWSRISAIPLSAIDTDVEYGPPDTVHIVGYPLGWPPTGNHKFNAAFWRTSSIASENNTMGTTQANAFFVDPRAPEGMTGSPVVGMKEDRLKLLGVYSDHSAKEFGVEAGLVWDACLIKEFIDSS